MKPYRLPKPQKAEIDNKIKVILKDDVIEEIQSGIARLFGIPRKLNGMLKDDIREILFISVGEFVGNYFKKHLQKYVYHWSYLELCKKPKNYPNDINF